MANEAVIVDLGPNRGNPVDFTVADGVGISKGSLMSMGDLRSASKSGDLGESFAGIAAADKEASDGATNLALYQEGIFDLTTTGGHVAIVPGMKVKMSGANLITGPVVEADIVAGDVVGTALEAAALQTQEVIEVDIGKR